MQKKRLTHSAGDASLKLVWSEQLEHKPRETVGVQTVDHRFQRRLDAGHIPSSISSRAACCSLADASRTHLTQSEKGRPSSTSRLAEALRMRRRGEWGGTGTSFNFARTTKQRGIGSTEEQQHLELRIHERGTDGGQTWSCFL